MKFESTALSLLVAAAFCAAPALALSSGTGHGPHPNPHPKPVVVVTIPLTAIACDSDNDFFDNGGVSRFTGVSTTTGNKFHKVTTTKWTWSGGLSPNSLDGEDAAGVRADAQNFPATNFSMTVSEFSVFSDPQISFFFKTTSGWGYDSFAVNDTLLYPPYVSSDFATTPTLTIDGTTATPSGALWEKIYLFDFGTDDGSPESFSDSVQNFTVNGNVGIPVLTSTGALSNSSPSEDCDF